jgi:hypothetical protein
MYFICLPYALAKGLGLRYIQDSRCDIMCIHKKCHAYHHLHFTDSNKLHKIEEKKPSQLNNEWSVTF